jgi:hypothetical protein
MRQLKASAVALTMTAALIAAPASLAASAKVTLKSVPSAAKQVGTKLTGKYTGTFGKCTMKGKLVIPKTVQTLTCKGGTFSFTATSSTGTSNNVKGTWKITGGTGKYKGIKGGGSFSGTLSTNAYTYTGHASY